jgi:hypothetical protein
MRREGGGGLSDLRIKWNERRSMSTTPQFSAEYAGRRQK